MPRAELPPPPGLLGRAGFQELLDAIRATIAAEFASAAAPQLLDGVQARKYLGLSRSGWFRALAAGQIPKPVFVEGTGDRYRRYDLDRFVERLKARRRRNKVDREQGGS